MLAGEGIKRLESFLFELLLKRRLSFLCSEMSVAYGWLVVHHIAGDAGIWIRLLTETSLGACDKALVEFLSREKRQILLVKPETTESGWLGSWFVNGKWQSASPLPGLLSAVSQTPRPVQEPDQSADTHRAVSLLDELMNRLSDDEVSGLAFSRILINCYISPLLRVQPNDIDAVVLNDRGNLRFIEFKRKYPARQGYFGLDAGHVSLMKWLFERGSDLSYLRLVDPCWNDEISPLHLIRSLTTPFARWVGAHVTPVMVSEGELQTSGSKSGMRGQIRKQAAFPVELFRMVGTGISGRSLKAFVNEEELPPTSMEELVELRQAARRTGGCV